VSTSLTLLEPHPAWSPAAHRGRLADRDVVALLGPKVEGAVERSRERGAPHIGVERPGSLTLLDVVPADGRAAWLYPPTDGVSLGCVLAGELPPIRVAAELVAAVADRLLALGDDGVRHPGPAPHDVLVTPDGEVWLTGFVGPTLPDPGRRPPGPPGSPEADAVYRLGVLLSELLTGGTPPAHTTEEDHLAIVRRVLIRIMSRPGPVFSERYRDWVQGMLAFAPDDRPLLSRIPTALRSLAEEVPGLASEAWCAEEVPRRRRTAVHPPRPDVRTTDQLEVRDMVRPDAVTRETQRHGTDTLSGSEELPLDDVTAVSHGSEPRRPTPRRSRPEVGAIPVSVGPPAEVARKRPTLPAELFSEDASTRPKTPTPPRPSMTSSPGDPGALALPSTRTLVLVSVGLLVLCVVLAAYVFS